MSPACDGVSVFHTFQLQSGRVPSFPPGTVVPSHPLCALRMPPVGISPACF